MLENDIAAGRLLTPFPEIVVSRTGYVALTPLDADKTASLRIFIDWLVAEGSAQRGENAATIMRPRQELFQNVRKGGQKENIRSN